MDTQRRVVAKLRELVVASSHKSSKIRARGRSRVGVRFTRSGYHLAYHADRVIGVNVFAIGKPLLEVFSILKLSVPPTDEQTLTTL